jgi:hypothetical protein
MPCRTDQLLPASGDDDVGLLRNQTQPMEEELKGFVHSPCSKIYNRKKREEEKKESCNSDII